MQTRKAARAIITDLSGQRILLCKRAKGAAEGLWSLPGGKPDDIEDLESAVKREVSEETGLHIAELLFYATVISSAQDTTQNDVWETTYFTGMSNGNVTINNEHSEAAYFAKTELPIGKIAFDHEQIILGFFADRTSAN